MASSCESHAAGWGGAGSATGTGMAQGRWWSTGNSACPGGRPGMGALWCGAPARLPRLPPSLPHRQPKYLLSSDPCHTCPPCPEGGSIYLPATRCASRGEACGRAACGLIARRMRMPPGLLVSLRVPLLHLRVLSATAAHQRPTQGRPCHTCTVSPLSFLGPLSFIPACPAPINQSINE